jgi:hypothetical protein
MPSENHILMQASANVSHAMSSVHRSAQENKPQSYSTDLSDHVSSIVPGSRDHPSVDAPLMVVTASPQAVLVELPINNTEAILHDPHSMVEVAEEDLRDGLVPSGMLTALSPLIAIP